MQKQKSPSENSGQRTISSLNSTPNGHFPQGQSLEEIESALDSQSPDCDRGDWVKIGMALKNGLGEAGFQLFDKWSQGGANYNAKDCQDTWKSIQPGGGITIKTLFGMARKAGWRWTKTESRPPSKIKGFSNPQSTNDSEPPAWLSDGPPPETYESDGSLGDADFVPPGAAPSDSVGQADSAAEKARLVLAEAIPAKNDNPYLARKGVSATSTLKEIGHEKLKTIIGYRPKGNTGPIQGKRVLVVPIYVGDKLSSLGFIDENGGKAFLFGGKISGGYWATQSLPENDMPGLHFLVGEGVATVLSAVHAVPGGIGVAALMNGNLPSVARFLRGRYPEAQITILADLEKSSGETDKKAVEAARELGLPLAVPDFGKGRKEKDTDFNDLHKLYGLENVRKRILAAKIPGPIEIDFLSDENWPDKSPVTEDHPPNQFPVNSLPPVLRETSMEVARFTKTDVASPAVVGLSVAATAVGKKIRIEERPGLCHSPSLFFAVIAKTGERKSPVFKAMAHPLEQWAVNQEPAHHLAVAKALAENAVIDGILTSMKRQSIKARGEEREILIQRMAKESAKRKTIPPHPRKFTTDCTEEKLFQKLFVNDGEYSVLTGEGRQIFDAILGKYSGGNRTGDGIYLAGISGDAITRDRVGNEKSGPEDLAIISPCLNVCAMVQPDKFFELLNNPTLRESGLIARILPAQPISRIGSRFEELNEQGLNESVMAGFYQKIDQILNLKLPPDSTTGKAKPCLIRLSLEAQEARRQWHNVLESEMRNGGELEHCRDIAAKIVTQTVKIAAILHCLSAAFLSPAESSSVETVATVATKFEISLATWKDAQLLGEYFLETAMRFRDSANVVATSLATKNFVDWLKKVGQTTVKARDILRKGPRPRMKNSNEIKDFCLDMQEIGILKKHPTRDEWLINPKLF